MQIKLDTHSENRGCGDALWFWFFVAIVWVAFWPSREAGFVTDWLGWQMKYEAGTWRDVPSSFHIRALHPVLHGLTFLIFKVFGTKALWWYVIFGLVHGANSWLIYSLVRRLVTLHGGKADVFTPLAAALLFALSPFNAEPVIWRVCFHYLLSGFFILKALHNLFDYFEDQRVSSVLWVHFWVLLGLFSLEWALVAPAILVVFAAAFVWIRGERTDLIRRFSWLVLPQAGLVAGWFLLNKKLLGSWVGHYGAETHLNLDPKLLVGTAMKYFVKHTFFVRYFEHATKATWFENFEKTNWILASGAFFGLIFLLFFIFFKKISLRTQWGGVGLACFFIALLPVLNLYFYFLDWSENDRYGYPAMIFWSIALVLLASGLRWFYPVLVGAALLVSVVLLRRTVMAWHDAAEVTQSLVQDFRWFDKDEVIVLASPDNLKGAYLFRVIGQENSIAEHLALLRRTPFKGRMIEAVQFNLIEKTDGIKIETDSTGMAYRIDFQQTGNWFRRNGLGATSYENDRFRFEKRQWDAVLTLKERKPNSVLIYPVGGRWEEAK